MKMKTQKYINTPEFWERIKTFAESVDMVMFEQFEVQEMIINISNEMIENCKYIQSNAKDYTDKIFYKVCEVCEIEPAKAFENNKVQKREFVELRNICFYIWHIKGLIKTLKESGKYFDKDHTTVIHGIKTITNLIETEPEMRKKVNKILDVL